MAHSERADRSSALTGCPPCFHYPLPGPLHGSSLLLFLKKGRGEGFFLPCKKHKAWERKSVQRPPARVWPAFTLIDTLRLSPSVTTGGSETAPPERHCIKEESLEASALVIHLSPHSREDLGPEEVALSHRAEQTKSRHRMKPSGGERGGRDYAWASPLEHGKVTRFCRCNGRPKLVDFKVHSKRISHWVGPDLSPGDWAFLRSRHSPAGLQEKQATARVPERQGWEICPQPESQETDSLLAIRPQMKTRPRIAASGVQAEDRDQPACSSVPGSMRGQKKVLFHYLFDCIGFHQGL